MDKIDNDLHTANQVETLFLNQLETIDRAVAFASHSGALRDDDREDFASWVKLKLIEKDYAIIRKYERRASFAAFISVVVQRLLLDYRIARWGKWHASAEAKRLGEAAVTIEAMLYRDGRTIDEVLPVLIRRWPHLTQSIVDSFVRRLPLRGPRRRDVALDEAAATLVTMPADDQLLEAEWNDTARRIAVIVRRTVRQLDERDRLIFRLHFEGGMSVAEISRTLQLEQKPLYRCLRRALSALRSHLEAAGVNATDAEQILARRNADLDFGFGDALLAPRASSEEEGP